MCDIGLDELLTTPINESSEFSYGPWLGSPLDDIAVVGDRDQELASRVDADRRALRELRGGSDGRRQRVSGVEPLPNAVRPIR